MAHFKKKNYLSLLIFASYLKVFKLKGLDDVVDPTCKIEKINEKEAGKCQYLQITNLILFTYHRKSLHIICFVSSN